MKLTDKLEGISKHLCITTCAVGLLSVAYWSGLADGKRQGESTRIALSEQISKIECEALRFKINHYGIKNYYFTDSNGRLFYVKKAKDLDNPSKWILTK